MFRSIIKLSAKQRIIFIASIYLVVAVNSFFIFVYPPWTAYKKISKDILSQQNLLKQSEGRSDRLQQLEAEHKRLQNEYQLLWTKQQKRLQRRELKVPPQDVVSFFTDWARFVRDNNVKLIEVKPHSSEAEPTAGIKTLSVSIILEGKYNSLLNLFTHLDLYARLGELKNVVIGISNQGYPNLRAELNLNLPLK